MKIFVAAFAALFLLLRPQRCTNRRAAHRKQFRWIREPSAGHHAMLKVCLRTKAFPMPALRLETFAGSVHNPPSRGRAFEMPTALGHRCWVNTPEEGLGGSTKAVPQDEDCLYLNVWTTARSASERRPVMVWIHGGGFQFGTSRDPRTDGALLATKGVVLVSMNYRIGVFGFFADPRLRSEGRLSSNFGIQDQIAALQWVKANITSFGGDPANVTVFGESAGSQSVSILMGSPLAKGLFQKAIGESGSSLQHLPGVGELALRGAAYAGALGAKSIADLRAMPAERLNTAAAWDFHGGAPIIFAPCIDGYVSARPAYDHLPTGAAERR